MVFIHGGGYSEGTANDQLYGADFLVERGVIYVSQTTDTKSIYSIISLRILLDRYRSIIVWEFSVLCH